MRVAGPKVLFDEVSADLARMTGWLQCLGERADIAAIYKLFDNAMTVGLAAVTADVLTIAQAGDVAPENAIKLVANLDLNAMVAGRGMTMAKDNCDAGSSRLTWRDLRAGGSRPHVDFPGMIVAPVVGRGAADRHVSCCSWVPNRGYAL